MKGKHYKKPDWNKRLIILSVVAATLDIIEKVINILSQAFK
ncbi:hypothetical protein AB9M75_12525 [Lactobacillus sp. AN1001]